MALSTSSLTYFLLYGLFWILRDLWVKPHASFTKIMPSNFPGDNWSIGLSGNSFLELANRGCCALMGINDAISNQIMANRRV